MASPPVALRRGIMDAKHAAEAILRRAMTKSAQIGGELVRGGRDLGAKGGDLLKGTTLRDLYELGRKAAFRGGPQGPSRCHWPVIGELGEEQSTGRRGAAQRGIGAGEVVAVHEHQERRRIVVTHRLPIRAEPNPEAPHGFDFSLDPDALPLEFSRGLPHPVVFVGALPPAAASIPASEELAADLLARFSCSPVFLGIDLREKFYGGFCEHYLEPLLLPLTPGGGLDEGFDGELYRAYLTANRHYADRVCDLLNPDEDLVFIHDYHLWALPTILRHKSPRARIGFFLYSPFPCSEIFDTIPVREELLRDLLNADLVGFHTYDYARHFLSACSRLLAISSNSRRGYIGIDYLGRVVGVKIVSAGVDMSRLREVLSSPETAAKSEGIAAEFAGRRILLSVDGSGIVQISAMEKLLESRTELRGRVVLLQISNPARSPGRDIDSVCAEVKAMRDRINGRFSLPGYDPIVMIDDPLTMHEKLAFYTSADICIVTAVRDGLNRTPCIYTACRQEGPLASGVAGAPRESTVITLSEFVGCSPFLSGAVRVNPWNVDDVTEGMNSALMLSKSDRQMRQEKHYMYVITQNFAYWRSLDQDLQRVSRHRASMNILNFRGGVLPPRFQKLSPGDINPSFHRSGKRLILLDYDNAVEPSQDMIETVNVLCSDPRNTIFVLTGGRKDVPAGLFEPCGRLGILAEHGYFTRWSSDSPWESVSPSSMFYFRSKNITKNVMERYTDTSNGPYIEDKQNSIVWHYVGDDFEFGARQAKEMQDILHHVLAEQPVYVKSSPQSVEVIPESLGKGRAVLNLIATMESIPDFILCVGDDAYDKDMFEAVNAASSEFDEAAEIFTCTVGNKPCVANYYLNNQAEVRTILEGLANSA